MSAPICPLLPSNFSSLPKGFCSNLPKVPPEVDTAQSTVSFVRIAPAKLADGSTTPADLAGLLRWLPKSSACSRFAMWEFFLHRRTDQRRASQLTALLIHHSPARLPSHALSKAEALPAEGWAISAVPNPAFVPGLLCPSWPLSCAVTRAPVPPQPFLFRSTAGQSGHQPQLRRWRGRVGASARHIPKYRTKPARNRRGL